MRASAGSRTAIRSSTSSERKRVAVAAVDAGQVVQHPDEDRALGRGRERDVVEAGVRARGADEQRLRGPGGRAPRRPPNGSRISGSSGAAAVDADQEVSGEADARGAEAETAGDLEVEDRERDRDADLPVEHLGEEAVARVVVVVRVAAKAELGEQRPGQGAPGLVGRTGGVDGGRRPRGERIERAPVRLDVEAFVFPGADQQRGHVELDVRLVALDDRGEALHLRGRPAHGRDHTAKPALARVPLARPRGADSAVVMIGGARQEVTDVPWVALEAVAVGRVRVLPGGRLLRELGSSSRLSTATRSAGPRRSPTARRATCRSPCTGIRT